MLKLITVAVLLAVAQAADFEIKNLGGVEIAVGLLGNYGKEIPAGGGFPLAPGETRIVSVLDDWAGRIWAKTGCNAGTSDNCETGVGGGAPASLAEITLGGPNGIDFYDISLVDGYNIQLSFEPVDGVGDDGQYSCKRAECEFDINSQCPAELQYTTDHGVVACLSACAVFKTDEYCCGGAHNTPETCKSSDWPFDYPAYFKIHCPDAYSYAYDDNKSTYTCHASKYIVTFGN